MKQAGGFTPGTYLATWSGAPTAAVKRRQTHGSATASASRTRLSLADVAPIELPTTSGSAKPGRCVPWPSRRESRVSGGRQMLDDRLRRLRRVDPAHRNLEAARIPTAWTSAVNSGCSLSRPAPDGHVAGPPSQEHRRRSPSCSARRTRAASTATQLVIRRRRKRSDREGAAADRRHSACPTPAGPDDHVEVADSAVEESRDRPPRSRRPATAPRAVTSTNTRSWSAAQPVLLERSSAIARTRSRPALGVEPHASSST